MSHTRAGLQVLTTEEGRQFVRPACTELAHTCKLVLLCQDSRHLIIHDLTALGAGASNDDLGHQWLPGVRQERQVQGGCEGRCGGFCRGHDEGALPTCISLSMVQVQHQACGCSPLLEPCETCSCIVQVSERETAALERHIATQQPVSTSILRAWFPSPFLVTTSILLLALGFTALILMWKVMPFVAVAQCEASSAGRMQHGAEERQQHERSDGRSA